MPKVLVAMSGGVDSSAAALLLQAQHYEVIGATGRMFANEDVGMSVESRCCSLSDVEDARQVAEKLGIEHKVIPCFNAFREHVLDKFVSEYAAGRTPNPCVDCNKFVKFGALFERARELGCDYLATGHYAAVTYDEAKKRWLLCRAADTKKDQSYMLYSLSQEQLAHVLFPLGQMTKPEIRKLAADHGFVNAAKPDSQDICFVPDGDYAKVIEFLSRKKTKPGPFVLLETGEVIGTHKGQLHYTLGQRKGLGIAYAHPLYVVKKDVAKNIVYLGPESLLFSTSLLAQDCNFISIPGPTGPLEVTVKTRYRQQDVPATLEPAGDKQVRVIFKEPLRAVTPGQAVVFYDGQYVVGGGTITAAEGGAAR
jgi:tRNA-specific 2-thiouridylase